MPITVFAPAKLNLYLHVTGRRADGYHLLESLVAFADIGDRVTVTPAMDFRFTVTGPYAGVLAGADNIVVRAAQGLAALCDLPLRAHIALDKQLPVAGGIGGGSADAAAALRGLLRLWAIAPEDVKGLDALALSLGADVPVCLRACPARMTGIGEILQSVNDMPRASVVLVNPGVACPTPGVFAAFQAPFEPPASLPPLFSDLDILLEWLAVNSNSLTDAAVSAAPAVADALAAVRRTGDCVLARMSGSGATCFGLYRTPDAANIAAAALAAAHPAWWVRPGQLLDSPPLG